MGALAIFVLKDGPEEWDAETQKTKGSRRALFLKKKIKSLTLGSSEGFVPSLGPAVMLLFLIQSEAKENRVQADGDGWRWSTGQGSLIHDRAPQLRPMVTGGEARGELQSGYDVGEGLSKLWVQLPQAHTLVAGCWAEPQTLRTG